MQEEVFDEVVSGLTEFAGQAKVGPGLDPESEFGPLVSEEQFGRGHGYIDSGLEEGAEAVAGGRPENGTTAATSSTRPCSPASPTR